MKAQTYTKTLGASAAIATFALPVAAETLPVEGVYASRADIPADVEVIALEQFDGEWGYTLREDLTDILSAPVLNGAPFFRVIPASLARAEGNAPDAALRGAAFSRVDDRRTTPRVRKECVRKDARDKCIERREVRIPCREVTVEYEARVTLIARSGARLYEGGDVLAAAQTYCRDDYSGPDPDAMAGELAARFAQSLRGEFAPQRIASTPRLLEERKGLSKVDRSAFKQALRLTKNDPYGACLGFAALERDNPAHVSVLFNLGLCRESEDRLDEGESYYRSVLAIEPGKDYAEDGLRRIASRRLGEAQLSARGRAATPE